MSDLIMWQYCYDPNDINKAIDKRDENWKGLISTEQIISITYDTSNSCYVVFWRCNQKECSDSEKPNSSDSISRQAAIDALNGYFARIGKLKRRGLTKGEKAISLDTVGEIKTLPSAQPEVIRCKDCIYYRWEIDMCDYPYSSAHNVVHEYDYCSKAERRTDEH